VTFPKLVIYFSRHDEAGIVLSSVQFISALAAFATGLRSFGVALKIEKLGVREGGMRDLGLLATAHVRCLFVLKLGAALTRLIAGLGICIALFCSPSTL